MGVTVELGSSVSFMDRRWWKWVGVTVELGSFVSFKDRRWWQFVGGSNGGAWKLDGCHGVDEDRRWKLEIRPWEIQRLERGCGLEMGIERATNLKKW